MLTSSTTTKGALFTQEQAKPNQPCMSGVIELPASGNLNIAGFLKKSDESGANYLNLKVSSRDRDSKYAVYGRLFRNLQKTSDRSPDYTGYIELESKERLRIAAWKQASRSDQKVFLSLDIQPQDFEPKSDDGLPI